MGKTYHIAYYILRSMNENGQYICPNCGAEQTLDNLLDGCDYCKSKFDISAYEDKVMSVMHHQNQFEYREGGSSYAVVIALGVIGVLFGLVGMCLSGGLKMIFYFPAVKPAGHRFLWWKAVNVSSVAKKWIMPPMIGLWWIINM